MGEKISFIDLFGTELELEDEYAREMLADESAARAEDVAVLEARMDTFTALPAGSTSGDAELMDIRVGADGTTYANAGDAVRGQIGNLNNHLNNLEDNLEGLDISYKLSFTQAAGTNHSSGADKMPVNIKTGDIVFLSLQTPVNENVSIAWVATKTDGTTATIASGNNKSYTATFDISYISVYFDALTTGGTVTITAKILGTLEYLNKRFAVGQIIGYINYNWTNNTIEIPTSVLYNANTQGLISQGPVTLDASNVQTFFVLVINYTTNLYELLSYAECQLMDGSNYGIVAILRKGNRFVTSPFQFTFNGVAQTVTDKTLTVENGVADAKTTGFNRTYAVGYLQEPINFDTANATVSVPVGVMYKPGAGSYVVISAATLNIPTTNSAYFLCVNWNTSQYELLTYENFKSQATTNYSTLVAFNRAHPEACTTPFQVTVNGVSPIVTIDGNIDTYWKTEIDDVINDVSLLQTYENGVTFGFITDIHWETNWQKSPKLIDYIVNHSRVDMWVNGGDSASGDGGDGTEQKELLYNCIGSFGNGYKFYSLNGNHDTNQIGGGTMLTSAEIKNLVMPYDNDVTFGNGNYYYFDYRRTRFVCLDTGANGLSDSTQTAWAASVISASPLPVIVCMHIVKISYTDENPCPFFNDLITAIGSNTDGKVKMIIGGHSHHDFNFIASNGIPVIVLDTDSRFSDDGISRVSGTISEQCFSIVTIDYDTETINVTRVGSIGSDFTVSY